MADIPRAYKLNKEKWAADENGKYLYYFHDRKKLTSVALPEEQFDKLVAMDSEFYNLERRENAHKTTFKRYGDSNIYKSIDIENDDFGQGLADDEEENSIPGADFTDKIDKQCDIERKVCKTKLKYLKISRCGLYGTPMKKNGIFRLWMWWLF